MMDRSLDSGGTSPGDIEEQPKYWVTMRDYR